MYMSDPFILSPKKVVMEILYSIPNLEKVEDKKKVLQDILKNLKKLTPKQKSACMRAYDDYTVKFSKRGKPYVVTKAGAKRYCTSQFKQRDITDAHERTKKAHEAAKTIQNRFRYVRIRPLNQAARKIQSMWRAAAAPVKDSELFRQMTSKTKDTAPTQTLTPTLIPIPNINKAARTIQRTWRETREDSAAVPTKKAALFPKGTTFRGKWIVDTRKKGKGHVKYWKRLKDK